MRRLEALIDFVCACVIAPRFPVQHIPPGTIDVYLSRYYLWPEPESYDGEERALYLHDIQRSDADEEHHNHPWEWALSFVLTNGYWEERASFNGVTRRLVKPFSFNFIRANDFHRLELCDPARSAWTLVIRGPRRQDWSFYHPRTGELTAWREFQKKRETAK